MAASGSLLTKLEVLRPARVPGTQSVTNFRGRRADEVNPTNTITSNELDLPSADYNIIEDGDSFVIMNLGSGATGLSEDTTYYAIKEGSTDIALASSYENALADTQLTISGSLQTTTRLDFNYWKACGEVMNVGEFGRMYEMVRINNLGGGATRKFKGSYDNGTFEAELLFDRDDPGQAEIEEAGDSIQTYGFSVILPGGVGESEFFFTGLVSKVSRAIGGPNDAVRIMATIEIDHNAILEAAQA